MSSSRPRSRRRAAGPCPSCRGSRVVLVEDAVVLRVGRTRHRIEGIPHERCLDCGERVFSYEASRRIDDIVLRGDRVRAA